MQREGLEEIAKISKHGFLYLKQIKEKDNSNFTEEIENKIVVYSDIRFKFSLMTSEERLEEAKKGWKGSSEEIESRVKYARFLISKLEKEIFELAGEKI